MSGTEICIDRTSTPSNYEVVWCMMVLRNAAHFWNTVAGDMEGVRA